MVLPFALKKSVLSCVIHLYRPLNQFLSTAVWRSLPEKILMKLKFVLLVAIIKVKFIKCKMVALEFLEKIVI